MALLASCRENARSMNRIGRVQEILLMTAVTREGCVIITAGVAFLTLILNRQMTARQRES